MSHLSAFVVFLGIVVNATPMNTPPASAGMLAQQAPTVVTDAKSKSLTPQQSAETDAEFAERDFPDLESGVFKSDLESATSEKASDLEDYRRELKRAVDSGQLTEQAAKKAWDEVMARERKAGFDKNEDGDEKNWVEENLALFLTVLYGGIFALVASILLICFLYVKRRETARTAALESVTGELGLQFKPEGDDSLMAELEHLPLFKRGRRKKLHNLIIADTPDLRMNVFDYLFITGYGRSQKTHRTTVVSLRSESLNLPGIQIRPRKAFADSIKSMLGAGGLSMEEYPAFAKAYVVQSDQPQQASDFLDAEMVTICERNHGCSLECQQGVLLHFRAGKRVEPDSKAIRDFIGEGFQLFQDVSERLQRKA